MPDVHGFNELQGSVRCTDCHAGGKSWEWPEEKRAEHALTHRTQTMSAATGRKEGFTMKDNSARSLAVEAIQTAGKPLTATEIADAVLATGKARLKGKTPKATISAIVTSAAKAGKVFKSDGGKPQRFTLIDAPAEPEKVPAKAEATPDPKPAAKKRSTRKRVAA